MTRTLSSEYMHWAKTQPPVRYNLASSEVPHFRLDRLPIDLAQLELDGASRYRDPQLRAAIARHVGVVEERVVMADGTSMANMLAMAALVSPGDEVVVEHPVYEPLVAAARFLGASVRSFERRPPAFELDPAAIAAAAGQKCRLIVITNLHNPSGAEASDDCLRDVGRIARSVNARVLVDEVYLDAASSPRRSASLLGDEFVATSSLTKVYGLSGLRCGWIVAEPELAERIWRLNELFGVSQAHADERLSGIALSQAPDILAQSRRLLERNRALVNSYLESRPEIEGALVRGGITTFPRLVEGEVESLAALLRRRYDSAIVPGRFFGLAEHFRLGFGQPTEILEQGLGRLAAALDELR
jgi:aspartate/methionine/tyrosine aminotransferase